MSGWAGGGERSLVAAAVAAALGVTLGTLAWHAASFLPFIADDALISLRYSERLLEGHGLSWTDGERVEGYSNLLWVLACAALGALGVDLIQAARVLGGLAMAGALLALVGVGGMGRGALRASLPLLLAGLAFALCGPIAVWTLGGLEQPLVAALLALTLALWPRALAGEGRARALVSLALAGLCITRPDGPLFAAVAFATLIASSSGGVRRRLQPALWLVLWPAVFTLAQLIFRLAYYGDWLPNTAYVKLTFSLARFARGAGYLGDGLLPLAGILLPAAVAGIALWRHRPRVRLALAFGLVWACYVVVIGGDIFPARRHFVPLLVCAAFLCAEGVDALLVRGRRASLASAPVALAMLVLLASAQLTGDRQNERARRERWEWDGQVVGRLLRHSFAKQAPLLAADPAGCLPYFSKLPALDMLGLSDRTIARNRPPDMGEGVLGHEVGDADYVLRREPDLVIFCSPHGSEAGCFPSSRGLAESEEFLRRYRLVPFLGTSPYEFQSWIWVRLDSPKIGIAVADESVRIPGYLMAYDESTRAQLDSAGRLGVAVAANRVTQPLELRLQPGHWRVVIDAVGESVVNVANERGSAILRAGDGATLRLQTAQTVHVAIASFDRAIHVRNVFFERLDTIGEGPPRRER